MVADPDLHLARWTSTDVRRMVEAGIVTEPGRFELIDGLILDKMSQNEPHRIALRLAQEALRLAFAAEFSVIAGSPIALAEYDEPEPDVMVVPRGLRRDLLTSDVLLLVEVADTSLRKDQTLKAALYARHGIPEYLILDVTNRRAEIRRRPQGEDWGETLILTESGTFTPLGASGPLRVVDLLPDPEAL